jgi:hypothetical protein
MHASGSKPLAPTRQRQRNVAYDGHSLWSDEEDLRLVALVQAHRTHPDSPSFAEHFPGKSDTQICARWTKVLDPSLVRGSWTRPEDETIVNFVSQHGTKFWSQLSLLLPGRIGKQCRERWYNALDPSVKHGNWPPEEDQRLFELHGLYGNQWQKIASLMTSRSDNAVKNWWHSYLSERAGPEFHPPRPQPRVRLPPIAALPLNGGRPAAEDSQSFELASSFGANPGLC